MRRLLLGARADLEVADVDQVLESLIRVINQEWQSTLLESSLASFSESVDLTMSLQQTTYPHCTMASTISTGKRVRSCLLPSTVCYMCDSKSAQGTSASSNIALQKTIRRSTMGTSTNLSKRWGHFPSQLLLLFDLDILVESLRDHCTNSSRLPTRLIA